MFQFQIGSIKSYALCQRTDPETTFQFQIGSIKSISVLTCAMREGSSFQFQIGSIKSCASFIVSKSPIKCFNSKLVRLKV